VRRRIEDAAQPRHPRSPEPTDRPSAEGCDAHPPDPRRVANGLRSQTLPSLSRPSLLAETPEYGSAPEVRICLQTSVMAGGWRAKSSQYLHATIHYEIDSMEGTELKFIRQILKPIWRTFTQIIGPKNHIILEHLRYIHTLPNLRDPKLLNEKIAYRKLYDRDPRMAPLIDKIASKEAMEARFGESFIIPTLAIYATAEEIDFTALQYPCVLKTSNASGTNLFLHTPPADEKAARKMLNKMLGYKHYRTSEEWAYSQIVPRILLEPLVDGGKNGLVDYKFHVYDGRVFAIQVDIDRFVHHTRCVMDPNWNKFPVSMTFPFYTGDVPRPPKFDQMLRYAEEIGKDFSYVRVDLYDVKGEVKFGEMTFYPGGGVQETFDPPEFERTWGDQWKLDFGPAAVRKRDLSAL
jgi:hypothetical protein